MRAIAHLLVLAHILLPVLAALLATGLRGVRMSPPPSVEQARRAIAGECIGSGVVERVMAGCSEPDALMRAVLNAVAADGWTIPPGPALRAACRAIQKRLEALAPKA